MDCLKVAERKIIADVHKFNHSALAWPSLQYGSEVKNEARLKEVLIEVPARRREHGRDPSMQVNDQLQPSALTREILAHRERSRATTYARKDGLTDRKRGGDLEAGKEEKCVQGEGRVSLDALMEKP